MNQNLFPASLNSVLWLRCSSSWNKALCWAAPATPLNLGVIQWCPARGHEWTSPAGTRTPQWAPHCGTPGQFVQGQEGVDKEVPWLGKVSNREGTKEEVREEFHSTTWSTCSPFGSKNVQSEVETWELRLQSVGGTMKLHLETVRLVSLEEG